MKYALDTNIITYYLKGNREIIDKIDNAVKINDIIIPPFVYYEIKKWLLAINSKNKLLAFEKLLEKYGVDIIDKVIFDKALSIYIKLRKSGITIDDGDLLIAAYCIHYNYILVSNNTKHYKNIDNLQVVNWAIP
jgi:predicted nucleic acid-binding protein